MSEFRPLRFNDASIRANELVANTKLGIGTHSQTSELHIKATAPELQIEGASATMKVVASGSETTFRSDQDVKWTSADAGTVHVTLDGTSGNVQVGTANLFVDTTTGYVGVGTTVPQKELTVAGNMELGKYAGDYHHFRFGGGNSSGFLYGAYAKYGDGIHMGYNFYNDNTDNQIVNTGGSTSRITMGYGTIGLYTGGVNSEPSNVGVYQTSTGYVGIGTDVPGASLHVHNGSNGIVVGQATLIKQRLGTDDYIYTGQHKAQLRIQNGLGTYNTKAFEFALLDDGTGVIQANEGNVGYNRLVLNPAGSYVGIGLLNASYPLQVAGSAGNMPAMKYFNSSSSGLAIGQNDAITIYAGGNIYATGLVAASDERIKKNIVDADDVECLGVLRLLKPKKYEYRDYIDRGEDPVWGFIAQEVRDILPYGTQLGQELIPNIYELANVSSSNVITFSTFNTSNLEANSTTIHVKTVLGTEEITTISEIIDEHTIRVEEDLTKWTGSVDETGNVMAGNQLFIYGQQVNDFVYIKKDAIWTIATAALQEVDRQLQAEKSKVVALETQLASVLTRLDALEKP
jgi:hypothetical protein